MVTLTRPDVILTHESDLDGFLAGLLCRQLCQQLFNAQVPLQAYHNHNWRQRPLTERAAWVCDLAFEPRLDRPHWVVMDHHPTDARPAQATLVHDPAKSSALLVYELCRANGLESQSLDRLVHLSNVADLFLEQDPEFALATDYANLVKTYQFWTLENLIEGNAERLLDHPLLEVMAVKRRVEDPIGLRWSRDHVVPISPQVGLVQTLVGNTNLIIHHLLENKVTPYPVLVTLVRRGGGPFLASLRSRNHEAAQVAERLQGGGHPNASGAILPRSVQNLPDAVAYLRQTLNPGSAGLRPLQSLEDLFDSVKF